MKVSIIITAYNVEKTITKSIKSALNQRYDDIEVVVVEDCSTDSTLSIIESIMHPNLRIIKNKENVGPGWSRRIGIETAEGEYVMTLDGDDYLDSSYVKDLIEKGEGADVISGGASIVYRDGTVENHMYSEHCNYGIDKIRGFFEESVCFINNKLIRHYLYEKHPYNTRRYNEDMPSIIPVLYDANFIKYVDNAGYYYCLREGSLTAEADLLKRSVCKILFIMDMRTFFENKPKEYKDYFSRSSIKNKVEVIKKCSKERITKFAREYPSEWKEFLDYIIQFKDMKLPFLSFDYYNNKNKY